MQYLHEYNILQPTVTEWYHNLQEESDNIMVSNTTQDLELIQLQSGLTTAQWNIISLGVLAGTANANALAAIKLANKKSWILFFQKPLRCDISYIYIYVNSKPYIKYIIYILIQIILLSIVVII